jgi:ribosomal protein S12 methylthiotransferase
MGCPKNVVDSENMTLLLERAGHQEAAEQEADIIIVNTCGFIDAAKKESLAAINDALRRKRPGQALVAAGCLVQRYEDELVEQIPGLDAVLGTRHWNEIVGVVERIAAAKGLNRGSLNRQRHADGIRRTSAYVKVADGCDRPCAFCAIPLIKGKFYSRAVDDIVADARRLAAQGVRELVFVAQETTAFGSDRGERDGLAELLPSIAQAVPEVPWLRFMYAYPTTVTPRLIETWAGLPQWVRYLDMPLQHAHPDLLRRMRRPHDLERTRRVLADLRSALPDLTLRTTFIVGYPGETEAEFQALLDFMSEVRFDNVGVFTYSREEGTPAADMPGQVPRRVQRERYRRAMLHQQRISLEKNKAWVGQTLPVLIEGQADEPSNGKKAKQDGTLLVGRSYRSAPEIDGLVFARGQARIGEIVPVRITQATEYDLWGSIER